MDRIERVTFERPHLHELCRHYTVVDMHFHTSYSDGISEIPSIVHKAKKLGIGIAITDHNEIKGAVEIMKYKGILAIPGIEVTSREGTHVLLYFYDTEGKDGLKKFYSKEIKPYMGTDVMSSINRRMEEILHSARRYNCLIIFPHPYCAAYTGICNHHFSKDKLKMLLWCADGVEAINSENLKKWNLKSALLGFNIDKAITAGSDGHSLFHMGSAVCYTKCRKERKAFLDAVLNKETKVVGTEIDLLRKLTSNSLKLRKNLKNYPDLIEKNIKYSYKVINNKARDLKEHIIKRLNIKKII
jgi:predicted metal-dependent phosphoesterase TrpH